MGIPRGVYAAKPHLPGLEAHRTSVGVNATICTSLGCAAKIANASALWYNKEHFNCTSKEKLCNPAP